jgi:O-antigen ligase
MERASAGQACALIITVPRCAGGVRRGFPMSALLFFVFATSLLWAGTLGTETRLLLFWPAAAGMGVCAALMLARGLALLAAGNLAAGAVQLSGDWGVHVLSAYFQRVFDKGRVGGFYNNPNHPAAFLTFPVFLGMGLIAFGRAGAYAKLAAGFLVVMCMLGMSLTVSRGGLVALAAGGLVFLLVALRMLAKMSPHLVARLGIGLGVLGLVAGAVLWKVNESFLRKRLTDQVATEDVRGLIWRSALDQQAENPLTGAGARMFYDGCIRLRPPEMPSWTGEAEFAHTEYAQALAGYGWLRLGLGLLLLAVHLPNGYSFLLWHAGGHFEKTGEFFSLRAGITIGAVAAVAASAVHAVVEFQWHSGAVVLMMGALLGILGNPGFERGAVRQTRVPGARMLAKALLAVCAAVDVDPRTARHWRLLGGAA